MSLSTTYTKVETDYLLQKLQSELASGLKGSLKITDTAPTAQGLYVLSDVGTYTNLGGLVTTADKLNYAYFDGTTWSLIATDLPQPIVNNYTNNNTYNLDPEQIVPSEALYNDTSSTLAGDVLKRVDINTGEDVNYRETTTWHDGSTMNDSKVDGVIYIKKGEKFYKRQFEGFVNVKWFGAKGDGVTDDSEAIQKTINATIGEIFIPIGVYIVSKTINLKNNIRLRGAGAGAIFSGEGYQRLSVIKPSIGFVGDSVINIDPLTISAGLSYMFGISVNDMLFDLINIKNEEKICLNILSLSNSETFSNIRIINNNKNIAINIDRSTSSG